MTTELQWFTTTKVYLSSSYLSQIGYVHAILIQRPKDLAGLLEENKSKRGIGSHAWTVVLFGKCTCNL